MLVQVFTFSLLVLGAVPLAYVCACKTNHGGLFEKKVGKLLSFLTCWCFIETTLAVLLGFIALFSARNAVLAHLALLAIGIFLFRAKNSGPESPISQTNIIGSIKIALVLIFLFAVTALRLFWNGIVWPTVEIDTLSYHLPLLAKLVQNGKISFLDHYWFQEHYPRHWETLCSLFALPFQNDIFILWPNLIARCLFVLAIVALAVRAKATATRAMAAGLLVVSAPIINTHMETMNVDLPFAGFFLATFYFALVFSETGLWIYGFLMAMAVSMFMGIKSTGLLYMCPILIALIWVRPGKPFHWYRPKNIPAMISAGVRSILRFDRARGWLIIALLLIPGLFWYVFNLIHFRNPMVGVQTSLFGHVLFPGYYPVAELSRLALRHVFHPFRSGDLAFLYQEILRELSYGFLILAAIMLAFLLQSLFQLKEFRKSVHGPLFLVVTCIALCIYYRTPFSGHFDPNREDMTSFVGQAFRLGFPFIGLMAVLAALGLEKFKLPEWIPVLLAVGLYVVANHGQSKGLYIVFGALALMLSVKSTWLATLATIILNRPKFIVALVSLALPVLLFTAYRPIKDMRAKNLMKRSFGPMVEYIDRAVPNGTRIAFPFSDASYIYCGSNFSKTVLFIPYRNSSFQAWIDSLRQKNVTAIGIGPSTKRPEYEEILALLNHSPENFEPLFGNAPGEEQALFRLKYPEQQKSY